MKTTRRTVAGAILLTTSALAVVLAGCQSSSSAGGAPSATVASSSTQPGDSPAANSPGQTAIPGQTTVTPSADHQATPECRAANLMLTLGQPDGAAGNVYQALEFTNTGRTPCTMAGFPGVSYVTGDNGQQVGAPAARDGQIGPWVALAPGQIAHSTVDFVAVGVFDQSSCQPTPVRGVRVYAPDDTVSMYIARAGTGCAGTPPSPQLRVQTVKPGVG